jgi:hypothetical protein
MGLAARVLLLVTATAALGCVTGGPTAHGPPSFRVGALGPAWHRIPSKADRAYLSEATGAAIMANGDCRERDAPLPVLANALLIGLTDRRVLEERRVPLAAREGLYRRLTARLDGVPLTIESYVVKKDGCVYDLVRLVPLDGKGTGAGAAAGHDDFAAFVAGFAVGDERQSASAELRRW